MAFVNESPRNLGYHIKQTASGVLGPGQYHNEGQMHKLAMEAIYPKKLVPFNSNQTREVSEAFGKDPKINQKQTSPGPGAYKVRSEFDLNKYIKEFDDRGTYLTIENGHLNQKKQLYNKNDNKKPLSLNLKKTLEKANATPGPGAYETNQSSVISTQVTKKLMLDRTSKRNLDQSPQGGVPFQSFQKLSIRRLNNLSIPTIPSRFLTPILKFDLHEKDYEINQQEIVNRLNTNSGLGTGSNNNMDGNKNNIQNAEGSLESVLVARVARLTNDGSSLGPGSYNIDQSIKAIISSPKGAIKWSNQKTKRQENFIKTFTQSDVGPGAYFVNKDFNRSINNPTIPREKYQARTFIGFQKKQKKKNLGSIRDDFEDEDSEEEVDKHITPGPGNYLQHFHTSFIGQQPILHKHPQNFGSVVGRFRDKHQGTHLGPGQYLSQNKQAQSFEKYLPKMTSNFASQERNDVTIYKHILQNPCPQEYMPNQAETRILTKKEEGDKRPFGVNSIRFEKDETFVPGAGTYKLPDSCQIKQPKYQMASYRSKVQKGLDQVIGKDNPGIGEYDTQNFKTIANKEFQGGASNNFVLFTRQNYQSRSPPVKISPRLQKPEERTPNNVGPGSYIEKKQLGGTHYSSQTIQPKGYLSNNLHFGVTQRFQVDEKKLALPGPGLYNEQNKWNKRTYNLKFLNFQANALNSQQVNTMQDSPYLQQNGQYNQNIMGEQFSKDLTI